MARPIIALLTDFGTRDHYVGAMKAVMLGICPDANLVDISHDIAAHDVVTAALELAACYRYFPAGTIFLVVVDPGVGSHRRGLGVETADYRLIAPDNGVLSAVLQEAPLKRAVELTERRYARATVSKTFEGRDRFAPAAAWLAKGIDLSALGRSAGDVQRLSLPAPQVTEGQISGEVVRVDRFGNLVSNIDQAMFQKLALSGAIEVTAGSHRIGRVVATYADAAPDEACALFGSTSHLEIAVNSGSAAERLTLTRGAPVTVRRSSG
jgi:S-adenosylmethionine hydrolase